MKTIDKRGTRYILKSSYIFISLYQASKFTRSPDGSAMKLEPLSKNNATWIAEISSPAYSSADIDGVSKRVIEFVNYLTPYFKEIRSGLK